MAPGYRHNGPSRRSNRNHADHDVYEGLPVRQWRRETVHVVPPPALDGVQTTQSIWDIELPWGMPKDSHLLPQHSQELLRAARSGRIYKRPAPEEEDQQQPEEADGAKAEKKEDKEKQQDTVDMTLSAKAWKQIPRHLEGSDVDFLAKRRKNLVGVAVKTSASAPSAPPVTLTKATVRRVDAEGRAYTQEVVAAKGEAIDGEVISSVTITQPAAEGFVTTPKRRPPIGRKKKGRGRKKKAESLSRVATLTAAEGALASSQGGAVDANGIKIEDGGKDGDENRSESGTPGADHSDDDDDDGDDGDDGDDQEGDDDGEGTPDQSVPPQPAPSVSLDEPSKSALGEVSNTIEREDTEMSQAPDETPVQDAVPDAMDVDVPTEVTKVEPESTPAIVEATEPTPTPAPAPAIAVTEEVPLAKEASPVEPTTIAETVTVTEPTTDGPLVAETTTVVETVVSDVPAEPVTSAEAAISDVPEPQLNVASEPVQPPPIEEASEDVETVEAKKESGSPDILGQLEQHLDAQTSAPAESAEEKPLDLVVEDVTVESVPAPAPEVPTAQAPTTSIEAVAEPTNPEPVADALKPVEPEVAAAEALLAPEVEEHTSDERVAVEEAPTATTSDVPPEEPKEPEPTPAPATAPAPAPAEE